MHGMGKFTLGNELSSSTFDTLDAICGGIFKDKQRKGRPLLVHWEKKNYFVVVSGVEFGREERGSVGKSPEKASSKFRPPHSGRCVAKLLEPDFGAGVMKKFCD